MTILAQDQTEDTRVQDLSLVHAVTVDGLAKTAQGSQGEGQESQSKSRLSDQREAGDNQECSLIISSGVTQQHSRLPVINNYLLPYQHEQPVTSGRFSGLVRSLAMAPRHLAVERSALHTAKGHSWGFSGRWTELRLRNTCSNERK